ncbi:MAG: hypothetical protein FIA92_09435 [Chloroflexi bacterium]|nr:hypothetical protein [Chloroflexota bacterium]
MTQTTRATSLSRVSARRLPILAFVIALAAATIAASTTLDLALAAQNPSETAPTVVLADALPTPPATTERVSVGADGRQGNTASGGVSDIVEAMNPNQAISADGRWVAFVSTASNLIPGEDHPAGGVFVRDRQSGTTFAVPWVGGGPFPSTAIAAEPAISADGAVVAFTVIISATRTGAILATRSAPYVLAWDRGTNVTEVGSIDEAARPIPGYQPSISADGRYVAYTKWFVDRNPPILSNLTASVTRIGGCSGPNSTTISVTATDAESAVASVTLYFTPPGGSTISRPMEPAGGNVWRYTIDRDPDWFTGQIDYRVQAVDERGNVSALLFPSSSNELFNDPCIL